MDGPQFDQLVRDLAEAQPRRRILKRVIGGAALALGIGVPGAQLMTSPSGEAAVCRAGGDICRKPSDCCSGTCLPKDATGRRRCGCVSGTTPCGTDCCASTEICVNGSCRQPTPTPTVAPLVCPECFHEENGACVVDPIQPNGCACCFENVGGICVPAFPQADNDGDGCSCGFWLVGGVCVPIPPQPQL